MPLWLQAGIDLRATASDAKTNAYFVVPCVEELGDGQIKSRATLIFDEQDSVAGYRPRKGGS